MKYSIFLFVMLLFNNLYTQKYDNIWTMGYGAKRNNIDYSILPPISTHTDKGRWLQSTNSAICSPTTGKLLFYTNGQTIYNALEDSLEGTSGFNPNNWTNQNVGINCGQACLILPFPSDTNLFYIFHTSRMYFTPQNCPINFYYSIIDMKQDSGRGGVMELNHLLLSDTLVMGGITACKHANGKDWWVLIPDYGNNTYIRYLIQDNSILGPYKQSIGAIPTTFKSMITIFSPNGKRYARHQTQEGKTYLFDFDRCTGLLSNPIIINGDAALGGIAFSPNSNVLYHSANAYFYQYDLTANDIEASKTLLAAWDGLYDPDATAFFLPQLASDNKIYATTVGATKYLHVVNYPDSLGFACNFVPRGYIMDGYGPDAPPNYPYFKLGADTSKCAGVAIATPTQTNISIYPNPVQEYLYIASATHLQGVSIRISDIFGREIKQLQVGNEKVFVGDMAEGVYFYTLEQEGKQLVAGKVVKVR